MNVERYRAAVSDVQSAAALEHLARIGTAASSPLYDSLMSASGTSGYAKGVVGAKSSFEAAVFCVCSLSLKTTARFFGEPGWQITLAQCCPSSGAVGTSSQHPLGHCLLSAHLAGHRFIL